MKEKQGLYLKRKAGSLMKRDFLYRTNLQYEVKSLRKQVADFESGEKYVNMQEEYRKTLASMERQLRQLKKELACSHAETIDVRNKWFQTCEDILKEKEQELAKKDRELQKMAEAMLEAQRQRDEALAKCRNKQVEVYGVKTQLDAAKGKLLELTARVNRDYTNSSKSSSQSPNHKKIHNGRERTGRRPGGQPGHIHHGRKPQEPTRTVPIPAPAEYENNSNYKPTGKLIRKQLVIMRVTTEVVEYITPEFRNQTTGQRVHAAFPEGLKDDVTYDGSVKAAAYLLNNDCYVSVEKTRTFLKEISDGKIDLSNGMICNLARQFSEKTQEERNQIFLGLLASPNMHADFTFGRMNGKQAAVILCATPELALYQGREKKGHEGIKGSPVELYQGTIISDHESTFLNYGTRHQECLVHVERYLRSSIENEPEREWNQQMLDWIRAAIHYRNGVQEDVADENQVAEFEAGYDSIIEKAREEYEYEPPNEYFRDGYNLYKRMEADKEDYLLFLHDLSVDPTNNLAERNGRKFKRKATQVMGFRSMNGVTYFCDGLSVIQTLKIKGENLYDAVTSRFNNKREAR